MDKIINRDKTFYLKHSSSSFKLSDVTGFFFGPNVSRFWMLRKHTMMIDKKQLELDAPFYAWDCITLSINKKWDVYLVIKNEHIMS